MTIRGSARREELLAGGRLPLDPLEGERHPVSEARLEEVLEELRLEAGLDREWSDGEFAADFRAGLEERAEGRRRLAASRRGGQKGSRALLELERAVGRALAGDPDLGPERFLAELRAHEIEDHGGEPFHGERIYPTTRRQGGGREVEVIRAEGREHPGVSLASLPGYFRRARAGGRRDSASATR